MSKESQQKVDKQLKAFEGLYGFLNDLTPEQKQIFNEATQRQPFRKEKQEEMNPVIKYNKKKDRAFIRFQNKNLGRPSKKVGRYEFWWDAKEGTVYAMAINSFTEELKDIRNTAKAMETLAGTWTLANIWKGKITDGDIEETRKELLDRLEKKWENFM